MGAVTLLCAAVLVVAGCTLTPEEPARVTVPPMNTTTSMPPDRAPPGTLAGDEPLPIEWIVQVGGPGKDRLDAVTGRGDRIVAVGSSDGELEGPPQGPSDAIVVVVDAEGELVALERAGGAGSDAARAVSSDGERVVACGDSDGPFGESAGGRTDLWCAPLAATGSDAGSERWSLGAISRLGGPDDERVGAVSYAELGESGYLAGSISGVLPGASDPSGQELGSGDAVAIQVDATGRPVWARQFGSTEADAATGVVTTRDGDGVLAGWTDGSLDGLSEGGRDAWITRFDPQGNQRWITQIGSDGDDSFAAVTTIGEPRRGDERFVAVGSSTGDLDGAGPDEPAGGEDAVAASFAPNGGLEWISQFGSADDDAATAVVADGDVLYLAGTTAGELGELAEDGGPGGGSDGFLAALEPESGRVAWIVRFGSAGDERVTGATITENGLLVLSGVTTGQLGDQPSGGGEDGFLIAFSLGAAGGAASAV